MKRLDKGVSCSRTGWLKLLMLQEYKCRIFLAELEEEMVIDLDLRGGRHWSRRTS